MVIIFWVSGNGGNGKQKAGNGRQTLLLPSQHTMSVYKIILALIDPGTINILLWDCAVSYTQSHLLG